MAEGFTLRVSYTEIHDRIKPTANVTATKANLRVHVQDSGAIRQDQDRSSGKMTKGSSKGMRLGGTGGGSWRVAGPNQLINIVRQTSYQRAILVTVNGKSCSARIAYNLNAGESEYRYIRMKTGEIATARSVKAEGITCSIE